MSGPGRRLTGAARHAPFGGMLVGLLAATVYWLGAQLWPTNVAVALAMTLTFWAPWNRAAYAAPTAAAEDALGPLFWVFTLLVKYNALMALTAASGPFPLPPHLTLGLIMIAGQAVGGGLSASLGTAGTDAAARSSALDLTLLLVAAFAPATLLGIPGLAGLVAAIVMRLLLPGAILPRLALTPQRQRDVTAQLTEVCFYLGAVATWRYV